MLDYYISNPNFIISLPPPKLADVLGQAGPNIFGAKCIIEPLRGCWCLVSLWEHGTGTRIVA